MRPVRAFVNESEAVTCLRRKQTRLEQAACPGDLRQTSPSGAQSQPTQQFKTWSAWHVAWSGPLVFLAVVRIEF
ncbi:hypothetical protein RRG08_049225 [Elysia crispata]|uniref:Uncharacterized protein n=1 Tax=Elysia crispata TaxID=231223 RepID=A0AAE1D4X1_9GAST|nr:hypothetical protein RRG08_049225 [Elysia crispata]